MGRRVNSPHFCTLHRHCSGGWRLQNCHSPLTPEQPSFLPSKLPSLFLCHSPTTTGLSSIWELKFTRHSQKTSDRFPSCGSLVLSSRRECPMHTRSLFRRASPAPTSHIPQASPFTPDCILALQSMRASRHPPFGTVPQACSEEQGVAHCSRRSWDCSAVVSLLHSLPTLPSFHDLS
jgi:hypothetical protein